jgi:protein FAM32A
MGDYDFKPSGSLKFKGVKDKKIKKKKEHKTEKKVDKETAAENKPGGGTIIVVQKTEAERRFEEIQRQRVGGLGGVD